jgi:porphyrinogen peroxidase
MAASRSPQSGIFALGTASHAYLEFDAAEGVDAAAVVRGIASLREPRTTMGGVNLVAGFRPEAWREVLPEDAPAELAGFDTEVAGVEGLVMPATQHDAVLWLSGSAYDVIFDVARPRSRRSPESQFSRTRRRAGRIATIST